MKWLAQNSKYLVSFHVCYIQYIWPFLNKQPKLFSQSYLPANLILLELSAVNFIYRYSGNLFRNHQFSVDCYVRTYPNKESVWVSALIRHQLQIRVQFLYIQYNKFYCNILIDCIHIYFNLCFSATKIYK